MRSTAICSALVCLAASAAYAAGVNAQKFELNIPRESLDGALSELSRVTGLQVARLSDEGTAVGEVGPLKGVFEPSEALDALLKKTNMKFEFVGSHMVRVYAAESPLPFANAASSSEVILAAPMAEPAGEASAPKQQPQAQQQPQESAHETDPDQVVVTGSRIVRDGYQAPTPVTVIGTEEIQQAPMQNIADVVNRLPAFGGGMSTSSGGNEISTGEQGENNVNLRSLGSNRTLVLLDGHRIVAGDVDGAVDVNVIPQALVSRIDVVTGGASAAYGSDAVAGVVNFVLDKNYTGLKAEVQGGITTYGDNESGKVNITGGTPFADGRGHLLFSGEFAHNDGIFGAMASRDWGYPVEHIVLNPAYTAGATNVPQYITARASTLLAAPGGIITSGPLAGTTFTQNGTPVPYKYGTVTTNGFNIGGDYQLSNVNYYNQSLANRLGRQNYFGRASYDLTDNITGYVNVIFADSMDFARSKLDDNLAGMRINAGNPYIPASLAAQMAAANIASLTMGSFNLDLPPITTLNERKMQTYAAGLDGKFTAFDTAWKWNVFGQIGNVHTDIDGRVMNKANFAEALNAVTGAQGQSVCAVNAVTVTNPGCVPWNPFGWNQNSAAAAAFIKGNSTLNQRTQQTVATSEISGEPFHDWAGAISVASGVEWREEAVEGTPNALSLLNAYTAGNFKGTNGSYTVTEGFLETIVPLAENLPGAQSLDFNGAVRATDYSTSGYVTTWKLGLTWSPIDDFRFRATRSVDIRAPDLNELFAAGTGGQSPGVTDPATGKVLPTFQNESTGNLNLKPERATNTEIGVVFQPTFLHGFSASVDFFDINIKGAVFTESAQSTLNLCYLGQQFYCNNIIRNSAGVITEVNSLPFNAASEHERGLDIESSYNVAVGPGTLSMRALGSHVDYLTISDGVNPTQNLAGDNADTGPLYWRWMLNLGYAWDRYSVVWTGRYMSSGHYGPTYVQFGPGMASTVTAQTLDDNHIPAVFYNDLSFSYDFKFPGSASGQAYVNIENVLNKMPPPIANAQYWYMPTNPQLYDTIGRTFYVGVRLKFM